MLQPPTTRPSVAPPSAEPLPPEVEVATPGAVLVVDEACRLRDRSPSAMRDAELSALTIGAVLPESLLATASMRRLVHEGSSLDALWLARGDTPIEGGLDERECGAMLMRLRAVVGTLVASLDVEEMIGAGPASAAVGSTRRREMARLLGAIDNLGHAFAPTGARTHVDLELVVRRAVDARRGSGQRRGITLHIDGVRDARRPRSGDEALLESGLSALVANAIDASSDGAIVRIGVEASLAAVTLTVEDDGPGLLKPGRSEVGAPFASTKRGGLGLGLVVAKRAAFVHGGELRVATRDRGHGVCATLWLPTSMG